MGLDLLILATSLAPLREICQELIQESPAWQSMVQQVQTVQTQALQLWMAPSLQELGRSQGSTVLTAFRHPLETWADMSQLVGRGEWTVGTEPGSIAYFCGTLPDAHPIPPTATTAFRQSRRPG